MTIQSKCVRFICAAVILIVCGANSILAGEFQVDTEKKWNTAISFNLSYGLPSGDYYDYFYNINGDLGFGGDIRFALSNHLAIKATVSRSGIDIDDDFSPAHTEDVSIFSEDYSLNATRIMAGLELYQSKSQSGRLRSTLYLHSMLGIIVHKYWSKVVFQPLSGNPTNEVITSIGEYTETQFALNIGVGTIPMLSSSIGINLSVDLDLVLVDASDFGRGQGTSVRGYVLDIHTGFVFFP